MDHHSFFKRILFLNVGFTAGMLWAQNDNTKAYLGEPLLMASNSGHGGDRQQGLSTEGTRDESNDNLEAAVKLQLQRPRAQDVSNELFYRAVNNVGCSDFDSYFQTDLLPRLEAMKRRGLSESSLKNMVWDYSKRRFKSFNQQYDLTTKSLIALFSDYMATGSVDNGQLKKITDLNKRISCPSVRPQGMSAVAADTDSHQDTGSAPSHSASVPEPESETVASHGSDANETIVPATPQDPVAVAPSTPPAAPSVSQTPSGDWLRSVPGRSGTRTSKGHSEPTVLWDSCNGRITGSYSGEYAYVNTFNKLYPGNEQWKDSRDVKIKKGQCDRGGREISRNHFNFLNKALPKCLAQSLNVSESQISSVHMVHVGILGDKNHPPRSLHRVSRAIDITGFEIQIAGESVPRKFNVTMYSYANKRRSRNMTPAMKEQDRFWRAFRKCAHAEGGYTLSYDYNYAHQGHVHLSLPLKGFSK